MSSSGLDEPNPGRSAERVGSPRPGGVALLFLAFLAAAMAATQPLSVDGDSRLPANADGVFNAWTLKTICGAPGRPGHPFQGNMFHPDAAPLLYSEPLVGVAIQVAPLCALGLDHVLLYNLTFVVILAMSALGAWLLAREITGSGPAALVAAVVFAFTSANYDSAARIQIVASQWTPFCFLYLIRFSRGGRLRDAALMGGAFAMQALSCAYYEIFLALLLVLSIPLWIQVAGGPGQARKRLGGVALAALISVALVVPVNLAQRRHLDPVLGMRAQAQQVSLSFFTDVLPTNFIYGGLLGRTRVAYDALYFPGAIPLLLGLWGLFRIFKRRDAPGAPTGVGPIVFIGVAAFLLALGASVSTPWGEIPGPLALLSGLPGLGQARVPSRFLMFSRLALAVVAACGAHRILSRSPGKRWLWASLLSLACFAEHWSVPLDSWVAPTRSQLPKVYEWVRESGRSVGPILEFPPSLQRLRREESMWLHTGAFHELPMVNGYSSFRPAWSEFVLESALQWPDERLLVILRQMGVRAIIVHPRPRGLPGMDEATATLLDFARDHPEQLRRIASFSDSRQWEGIWSRLGDEIVFEIGPGEPTLPAGPLGPTIDRRGWSCRSSEPGCELALDGDPATQLLGLEAQERGQFLRVSFDAPATIQAVSIGMGRLPEGFPRDAVIRLQGEGWTVAEARLDIERFLADMTERSTNPTMTWRFPAAKVTGFEIRLRSGGQGFRPLGLPEVNAHAAP